MPVHQFGGQPTSTSSIEMSLVLWQSRNRTALAATSLPAHRAIHPSRDYRGFQDLVSFLQRIALDGVERSVRGPGTASGARSRAIMDTVRSKRSPVVGIALTVNQREAGRQSWCIKNAGSWREAGYRQK